MAVHAQAVNIRPFLSSHVAEGTRLGNYSHFINSHFINSHFVNSHFVNFHFVNVDKVGIDEVGKFTIVCTFKLLIEKCDTVHMK